MTRILLTAGAALFATAAMGALAAAQGSSTPSTQQTTRRQAVEHRLLQRLDTRFARLDKNHDGVISKDEWPGRPAVFERLDGNHDGVLSKDELEQALRQRVALVQQRVQTRVDALFARVDRNQDGVISRDEWPGTAARFERLDTNRDGVLSKDEARPALSRLVLRRLALRRLLIGG